MARPPAGSGIFRFEMPRFTAMLPDRLKLFIALVLLHRDFWQR